MTRAEKAKKRQEEIEATICKWTELDSFGYRDLLYKSALEFLEIMEGAGDSQYLKKMASKRSFWNWWSSKWYSRDSAFIQRVLPEYKCLKAKYIEEKYREWHSVNYLITNTPIEDSYYHLIEYINI